MAHSCPWVRWKVHALSDRAKGAQHKCQMALQRGTQEEEGYSSQIVYFPISWTSWTFLLGSTLWEATSLDFDQSTLEVSVESTQVVESRNPLTSSFCRSPGGECALKYETVHWLVGEADAGGLEL